MGQRPRSPPPIPNGTLTQHKMTIIVHGNFDTASQNRPGYGPLPVIPPHQTLPRVQSFHIDGDPRFSSGGNHSFEPVEHIYESPKFERREYYELDPASVQADTTHNNSHRRAPQDHQIRDDTT